MNSFTPSAPLATYGVEISDDDYRSTIISCIPTYLSNYASSQLSAYRLLAPKDPTNPTKQLQIDPNILIKMISEAYDRQKAQ